MTKLTCVLMALCALALAVVKGGPVVPLSFGCGSG
jgi:hypothetical protein